MKRWGPWICPDCGQPFERESDEAWEHWERENSLRYALPNVNGEKEA